MCWACDVLLPASFLTGYHKSGRSLGSAATLVKLAAAIPYELVGRPGNQDDLFCQWSHLVLPIGSPITCSKSSFVPCSLRVTSVKQRGTGKLTIDLAGGQANAHQKLERARM